MGEKIINTIIGTAVFFFIGWSIVGFITWDWVLPLASGGSRVWLVVSFFVSAGVLSNDPR